MKCQIYLGSLTLMATGSCLKRRSRSSRSSWWTSSSTTLPMRKNENSEFIGIWILVAAERIIFDEGVEFWRSWLRLIHFLNGFSPFSLFSDIPEPMLWRFPLGLEPILTLCKKPYGLLLRPDAWVVDIWIFLEAFTAGAFDSWFFHFRSGCKGLPLQREFTQGSGYDCGQLLSLRWRFSLKNWKECGWGIVILR